MSTTTLGFKKALLRFALTALLLPGLFARATDRALVKRLDAVVDRALAGERIVGVVIFVARDGEIVYHRAAGFADREARKPMREDAVFRLSSLTKPFVTTAALSLIEKHPLGLDDPVTKWVPEFRPKLPDGREPVITIRQLFTHTAGLTYGFFEPENGAYHRAKVSDGMDQPGLDLDENLRRLASVPLVFPPGTAWGYSLATDLLGKVIERAVGAPLPEVVRRTVTEPLQLLDTDFVIRDRARLVTPYADATPRPARMSDSQAVPFGVGAIRYSPSRIFDPKSYPSGGAGMVGTAGDFLTLLETLRTGGGKILKPKTTRIMTSNAIGDLPVPALGAGWGFGLGMSVLKDPLAARSPQAASTWQWGGVYGHHWFVDPKNRLSVVVLTNTAIAGMIGAFPDACRSAIYGR
jgi:CubicO group peptidase (beta-lactamase class C family)